MKMIRLHFKDSFDRDWKFNIYENYIYVKLSELGWLIDFNPIFNTLELTNKSLPKWLRNKKEVLDFLEKIISNRAFL